MATTTKKSSKNKAKLRRRTVKASSAKQVQTVAELRQKLAESLKRENAFATELQEAREQQTATSEILRVIASSPTDLESVFDEILANAARLCDAKAGTLFLHEDGAFKAVAFCGATPAWAEFVRNPIRPGPDTGLARLIRDRKPIHIADVLAEPLDPDSQPNRVAAIEGGARSVLHVPMLKEQTLIGAINIYRHEVCPFTDNQIKLLETFADQAVNRD
jgi:two-component system NtrC family sensor kinase